MEGALVLEMPFVPRLLRVRPEAARKTDPLHLALEHDAAESVVIALLRAHPEGSRHADQSISRHPAIRRDRKKHSGEEAAKEDLNACVWLDGRWHC